MAEEAARRAGYSSVAAMKEELEKTERLKKQMKDEDDQNYRREHRKKKGAPLTLKEELKELLASQVGHGDRVRAAIRDREQGERVVRENNEVTRRIFELRERIKELEKY